MFVARKSIDQAANGRNRLSVVDSLSTPHFVPAAATNLLEELLFRFHLYRALSHTQLRVVTLS